MTDYQSRDVLKPWHKVSHRHLLCDMHIPDWNSAFLKKFDPLSVATEAQRVGAGSVMIYFQAHTGICYWPTESGKLHTAFAGRDLPGELIHALHERAISVCAYYSVNFNNWAANEHPNWRIEPAMNTPFGGGFLPAARYGICCFNNPDYRQFLRDQTLEIVRRYEIEGIFFDMVWWQSVCLCKHCQARHDAEFARPIPQKIDWFDPQWCAFQSAREGWLTELAHELRETAKAVRPDMVVYHNFATSMMNWTKGVSFDSARAHDFLGGDFYGGRDEQLVVSRLMTNLSSSRPAEFMTTVTANLAEHTRLMPVARLQQHALAATASGASFLMIASINPDGTIAPAMFNRIARAFEKTAQFDHYVGGEPIEDIGIYFSSDSKMRFSENGMLLRDAEVGDPLNYPHFKSVRGACAALQRAHLPFGVITRRQLDQLDRYSVIVLPNVLRMSGDEIAAFRCYVENGGRVFASGETSLTETEGRRHKDFMLADVFGCSHEAIEQCRIIYLRLKDRSLRDVNGGEAELSHWLSVSEGQRAVRLSNTIGREAKALAALTLPYAHPEQGAFDDENWASIHSFPPWQAMSNPTIVANRFGRGSVIYCAATIEAVDTDESTGLFTALIRKLLGDPPSFEAVAHPAVWMTGFRQSDQQQLVLSFLNYQEELPVLPVDSIRFWFRLPEGKRIARLTDASSGKSLDYQTGTDGRIASVLPRLCNFAMIIAEFE